MSNIKKIFIELQIIILVNLFAFLMLWHILDAIFQREVFWKLVCLGISLFVLLGIIYFRVRPLLHEIDKIKNGK